MNREEFHDREVNFEELIQEFTLTSFFLFQDFTINVQPFARKVVFPELPNGLTDFTYMSHDCFHLSQKGYALGNH